ncbi:uncharacterized protein IAS62_000916 [Cryptococcus decagattii]|uniref:Chromatin structure-remodeling complex subunit SFH1 n=1 Tax=Cryptococcus decagattii TaxID=1859122 RepID=A0ABZ2AMG2_9TREE
MAYSTRTRVSTPSIQNTYTNRTSYTSTRPAPSPAPVPILSHQAAVYQHPQTYPPGPCPFFLSPPGQKTTDPSLSTQPTTQALYTTYPSRLRTGVTGLIQPERVSGGPKERKAFLAELDREMPFGGGINTPGYGRLSGSGTSTPRFDSPAPFPSSRRMTAASAATGAGLGSSRRGRVVNYAEKGSDDEDFSEEEDDFGEPASDPDDIDYGSRRRRIAGGGSRRESAAPLVVGGLEHQAAMRAGKLRRKMEELDRGWTWLGDRTPGDRVRSQVAGVTKHVYKSEDELQKEAARPEMLIPITIDFDVQSTHPDQQGLKIRDRFLWNLNEPFITPYQFSIIFCEDIGIPISPYAQRIQDLIEKQIEENQNAAEIDVTNEDVMESDVVWSDEEVEGVMDDTFENGDGDKDGDEESKEKQMEEEQDQEEAQEKEQEREQKEDRERSRKRKREGKDGKERNWAEPDCRVIVNLDVQIYSYLLRDRIEWDLSSPLPPSLFAKHYCTELGLTGEAIPAITCAITEEILKHKRDALDLDLFASTHPVEQAKWEKGTTQPRVNVNQKGGAKTLVGVWRDWWEREEFGPVLVELTMEEMEKRDMERTREVRRNNRAGVPLKRRR